MISFVEQGKQVLVLWSELADEASMKKWQKDLADKVTSTGKVQMENIERLGLANHSSGSFDTVLCGLFSVKDVYTMDHLALAAKVLKPGGSLIISGTISGFNYTKESVTSNLKLAGYVDVTQQAAGGDGENSFILKANKPNYEAGSSSKLRINLNKKRPAAQQQEKENAKKIWSLSAQDINDDDIELINDDELLREEDLKKPSAESLKAPCGSSGPKQKKKACKNCTCGLAEELESGVEKLKTKSVNSACGSCYLGDAFRCASCPYLGMPAFKPGEKVQLSEDLLSGGL